eukprot:364572-Chlamydomonas_euryale.AAC.2
MRNVFAGGAGGGRLHGPGVIILEWTRRSPLQAETTGPVTHPGVGHGQEWGMGRLRPRAQLHIPEWGMNWGLGGRGGDAARQLGFWPHARVTRLGAPAAWPVPHHCHRLRIGQAHILQSRTFDPS